MPTIPISTQAGAPIELYYESQGTGKPVVLIHGWPLSGRAWEKQIMPLVEAGYQVITYDRRGFGQSSKPWEGYDYDTLADDLNQLLEHLDLQDATLVGFSMGGGEVARYIGKYGSTRISKAVLASAVPPYLYASDDNPDGGLNDADVNEFLEGVTEDRLAFLEQFSYDFYTPKDGELLVSEPMRMHTFNIAAMASPKGTFDCVKSFSYTDFREDLKRFDVPTLVIHGSADGIVPIEVSGQRSTKMIANAKLVEIDGGPHGINVTHADTFNKALIGFLDE